MKKLKIFGKVLQFILVGFLALILVLNLFLIAARSIFGNPNPRVFGLHWAVVLSGSMEPGISVDDLVVSQSKKEYHVGDIITFSHGGSLTTHRIVAVSGQGYITQGDANNTPDARPVTQEQILGKVILTVPGIGRFIHFLRTPLGLTLLVLTAFAMIELPHLFKFKNSEGCEYEK